MGEANVAEAKKQVRTYMMVFAALLVGTIVTVAASFVDFHQHGINVAVGMAIAFVKATLVALFFMHLLHERKVIYWVLALCAVFFVFLLVLPLATGADMEYAPSPLVVERPIKADAHSGGH